MEIFIRQLCCKQNGVSGQTRPARQEHA